MNGRVVAIVGVLCIAVLAVSGAYADKPDKPTVPGQTKAECIVFTGDLESVTGGKRIEGCCLNAGPWPKYTMQLELGTWADGTHDGYLYTGPWFPGPTGGYVVQFWTWDSDTETPGDGDFFFEIWGGKVVQDRKSKLVAVTFARETGTLWQYHADGTKIETLVPEVSFELARTSNLSFCED